MSYRVNLALKVSTLNNNGPSGCEDAIKGPVVPITGKAKQSAGKARRTLRTRPLHVTQLLNEHLKRCYTVHEAVSHALFNCPKFPMSWDPCLRSTDGETAAQRQR